MNFTQSFPDELRSQITISDVVGKRVALKKKGKEHWGLCPFHNEDSPSFSVNDQKGFYHCFGCAAHGDIIGFVMNTEGLGFKDAVVKLANDFNIQIPFVAKGQDDSELQDKNKRKYLLLETACQFFEKNLFSHSANDALGYLYKRGLDNSQIKKFRLGYAPEGYENLLKFLKAESFTDEELLKSGIISKSDGGKLYDKFRNRVIFPITNLQGKIIAFGGRILGEGEPKYLNSSETELFHKGRNLYNFSNARKSIYDKKYVVIVEGYMDVISLAANGIENVVAPLGTALTADQLQILFRVTNDIVVCLDGDAAGIKAMRRSIDVALPFLNPQHVIRFAILPNGNDPDDFVRKNGSQKMEKILFEAENLSKVLFDFEAKDLKLDYETSDRVSPEKKALLEANLFSKIKLISDPSSKKYFSEYYKNLLFGIGRNKNLISKSSSSKTILNSVDELDVQDSYSLTIIGFMVHFPFLKDYQDELCILRNLEFKNLEISEIKNDLIEFLDQNSSADFSQIKSNLEKNIENDFFKTRIFAVKFSNKNHDEISKKLKLILLKYFYEEVELQSLSIMARSHEIEIDDKSKIAEKQRELFNYKTSLQKKILEVESDMT